VGAHIARDSYNDCGEQSWHEGKKPSRLIRYVGAEIGLIARAPSTASALTRSSPTEDNSWLRFDKQLEKYAIRKLLFDNNRQNYCLIIAH
jgi:hypothetical protein